MDEKIEQSIEISVCKSPQSLPGGVEVGVRIKHASGIEVESVNERSQFLNKKVAMAKLKEQLKSLTRGR